MRVVHGVVCVRKSMCVTCSYICTHNTQINNNWSRGIVVTVDVICDVGGAGDVVIVDVGSGVVVNTFIVVLIMICMY